MGVRARSNRSFYAMFWRFFASVRLAIVLIFLIAITALLGSLIQQEGVYPSSFPPEIYYPLEYGKYGEIMFALGLTRMYSSWWFLSLLLLIGVNLTVCSIDRFVPLIRTLKHPKISRSRRFISARQVYAQLQTEKPVAEAMAIVSDQFTQERFLVQHEGENTAYADKGRWGRYGPYVTHIGLLLLLVAALGMSIPGWFHDEFFWVAEGESARVPHTDFVIRNDAFSLEFYEDGRPKHFQTDAVVIVDGEEVHRHAIQVNDPLIYDRVNLLQASYEFKLGRTDFELLNTGSDTQAEPVSLGILSIDVQNPAAQYNLGDDTTVRLLNYFPNFAMDPVEGPVSLSSDPVNPTFILEITGPDGIPVRQILFVLQPDLVLPGMDSPYAFALSNVDIVTMSGLISHKNLALPYIYAGLVITVLGVFLSFYLYHRRVWIRCEDGLIDIGAMSNKHPISLEKEITRITEQITQQLSGTIVVSPNKPVQSSNDSTGHVMRG